MRIGVLTGGGDCPGLNAVIRAVVRKVSGRNSFSAPRELVPHAGQCRVELRVQSIEGGRLHSIGYVEDDQADTRHVTQSAILATRVNIGV